MFRFVTHDVHAGGEWIFAGIHLDATHVAVELARVVISAKTNLVAKSECVNFRVIANRSESCNLIAKCVTTLLNSQLLTQRVKALRTGTLITKVRHRLHAVVSRKDPLEKIRAHLQ